MRLHAHFLQGTRLVTRRQPQYVLSWSRLLSHPATGGVEYLCYLLVKFHSRLVRPVGPAQQGRPRSRPTTCGSVINVGQLG
jgi:hypothetical protein